MSFFSRFIKMISILPNSQEIYSRWVDLIQLQMGIGSGANPEKSGEKSVLNLLMRKYQSPYQIFDVGSNAGQYATAIQKTIPHNEYHAHCFEPAQSTFRVLMDRFAEYPNFICNNYALGKELGENTLYYDREASSLASLSKRRLDHLNISFDFSEIVKINTLNHYCVENKIDRIHLLKIDVEGHELEVLQGASNLFANKKIYLCTFEFGGCNIDTGIFFQDFWYFFKQYGMRLYRITPSGTFFPIPSYRENLEQFRTTNFLASLDEID